ncbi:hypothetical protein BJ741DRAFT_608680 [Chytriomyces cf. hyalinus JEL632]|nr:hypothetical protein BJ741DRAFT_608680 [Chytriomyces cf. hyalinus JEL632]
MDPNELLSIMESIPVKVTLNGTTRRFKLPVLKGSSEAKQWFAMLDSVTRSLYNLPASSDTDLHFSWQDGDGDVIDMDTALELQEALRFFFAGDGVVKLDVKQLVQGQTEVNDSDSEAEFSEAESFNPASITTADASIEAVSQTRDQATLTDVVERLLVSVAIGTDGIPSVAQSTMTEPERVSVSVQCGSSGVVDLKAHALPTSSKSTLTQVAIADATVGTDSVQSINASTLARPTNQDFSANTFWRVCSVAIGTENCGRVQASVGTCTALDEHEPEFVIV